MIRIKTIVFFAIAIVYLISGCEGTKARHLKRAEAQQAASENDKKIKEKLMVEFAHWKGVPHLMGGNSSSGIDCSGFVNIMYKHVLDVNVPRSTKLLMKTGVRIKKTALRPGDLLLFKPPTYPRHAGIYIGDNAFIHASKSNGVSMSKLDNPYWAKCLYSCRRVFKR